MCAVNVTNSIPIKSFSDSGLGPSKAPAGQRLRPRIFALEPEPEKERGQEQQPDQEQQRGCDRGQGQKHDRGRGQV